MSTPVRELSALERRRTSEHMARLRPSLTKKPQRADDWVRVRVVLPDGKVIAGPAGMQLRDGDEVFLAREDAAPLGRRMLVLGYTPAIPAPPPAVDGDLRTVIMLENGPHSAYLGRQARRGETATVPAEEARAFVRDGVAFFGQASARSELEESIVALVAGAKDAPARRDAAKQVAEAIRDIVNSQRIERRVADVCDGV
jgi:hypothetical protein